LKYLPPSAGQALTLLSPILRRILPGITATTIDLPQNETNYLKFNSHDLSILAGKLF
jgi:hypothetical protein